MCPKPQPTRIADHVLNSIESGRTAMRSRLSVLAERLGLDGIGVLLFLVGVLAVTLIFFWARSTELLDSLAFGSVGFHALLEAFPYQWLIIGILTFMAGAGLLKATHTDYQPPYRILVVALVGSIVLVGTAAAFMQVTERVLASIDPESEPNRPARAVYALTQHHGQRSVVGSVVETVPSGFIVQVGHENVLIRVTGTTTGENPTLVVPGDRILVVGSASGGPTIQAAGLRRLPQLPLPHFNWVLHRFPMPVSS